jgi:alpha-1,2-mannosyltransferase
LFTATLLTFNAFLARTDETAATVFDRIGHDFLPFYAAGTFVREGNPGAMYDVDALRAREQQIARRSAVPLGNGFGPFWNPPFYALPFASLCALSFGSALLTWLGINLAALTVAIALLCRLVVQASRLPAAETAAPQWGLTQSQGAAPPRAAGWRTWGLMPLLILASTPALLAFTHGQNTFCSLLLLTITVLAWRARRPLVAGLVIGLLAYKPQLAALVGLIAFIDLGWKVVAAAMSSLAILMVTSALAMPGIFETYSVALPRLLHVMQVEHVYMWERHVTLKAFWRLLLQGYSAGETSIAVYTLTAISAAILGIALIVAAFRCRAAQSVACAKRDWLIAATIAAMPLLMPFYFDYDLLLLAIPAVLYSVKRSAGARNFPDRLIVPAWCSLYGWMIINPDVAELTRMNLTVPLLAVVAGCLVARALQRDAETTQLTIERPAAAAPLAVAA